jgi:hypothetical protein
MPTIIKTTPIHFGDNYPTKLPAGWKLKQSPTEWAIAIAPDNQEYYLSNTTAYPRRKATTTKGHLKIGDHYIDLKNGLINLSSNK